MVQGESMGGLNQCSCLELLYEGQTRMLAGDLNGAISYLQMALSLGSDDVQVLTTTYSLLGNAYYYCGDFQKALEYHRYEVVLAKALSDVPLEAQANSNLGNTLKALGRYDEAIRCCQRHLELSELLHDKSGVAVAHYHLGNVYYARGKNLRRESGVAVADYAQQVRGMLMKAVEQYEMNLKLVTELGDRRMEGQACGNLGNTYYLLGDFQRAVDLHSERLKIAEEFGDKSAMRRAYTNLGNACVFLGELEPAVRHYRKSIRLAKELQDIASEAQSYYSLGNCFTLLGDHKAAAQYHLNHLAIARVLKDKVGEARAAWSLSNVCLQLLEPAKAFYFALLQHVLCKELQDKNGEMMADLNISELLSNLNADLVPDSSMDPQGRSFSSDFIENFVERLKRSSLRRSSEDEAPSSSGQGEEGSLSRARSGSCAESSLASGNVAEGLTTSEELHDQDTFFDYICRAQSKRMDDQRCDPDKISTAYPGQDVRTPFLETLSEQPESEDLLTMIMGMQSRRMDDQRATLPFLPGLQQPALHRVDSSPAVCLSDATDGPNPVEPKQANSDTGKPSRQVLRLDDSFIDMVIRCQDNRIEDQRSELPLPQSITVPDEAFFQFLLKHQARRIEEQRANFSAVKEDETEEKHRPPE